MSPGNKRHRWGDKIVFPHKSERECRNGCGVIMTRRHEGRSHWTEYWRGLDKISIDKTPACEPVMRAAE